MWSKFVLEYPPDAVSLVIPRSDHDHGPARLKDRRVHAVVIDHFLPAFFGLGVVPRIQVIHDNEIIVLAHLHRLNPAARDAGLFEGDSALRNGDLTLRPGFVLELAKKVSQGWVL